MGTVALQPFAKDEQSVIALGKGVAQIGTGTRRVVAITHFTVTEMNHEVILIDHFELEDLGSCYRCGCHQYGKQNDSLEILLNHIVY